MRLAFFLFAILLAGCAPSQRTVVLQQQLAELDSLRAVSSRLERDVATLQDSLQFYDDIESGYYYREKRSLEDRIEKLDFELTVCRDGGQTITTLLVDDLFEPASATLSARGAEHLATLAEALERDYTGQIIRIEGHTDSVPLGGGLKERYPTNWELSAARATAVVRHLTEEHGIPVGQIEAVAYGATRPVARNDTAEGRRLNRRVRIAVVPN